MANEESIEIEVVSGYSCKFNEGVGCHILKRHCENCGWNPEVARERLLQICFEKGITIPDEILDSM